MPTYRIFIEEISRDVRYKYIEAPTLIDAKFQATREWNNIDSDATLATMQEEWQAHTGTTAVEIRHDLCYEPQEGDEDYGKV